MNEGDRFGQWTLRKDGVGWYATHANRTEVPYLNEGEIERIRRKSWATPSDIACLSDLIATATPGYPTSATR